MTQHELNELKKLAKFLWDQAELMEKHSDDRLKDSDLSELSGLRAKTEAYKYTSTLLTMKLGKLQRKGNKQ